MQAIHLLICVVLLATLTHATTLPVNTAPKWNYCAGGGDVQSCSGHGACSGVGGTCVCTGGYSGDDCHIPPTGVFRSSGAPYVTNYCTIEDGSCAASSACIGPSSWGKGNLPVGVTGIAAVNPSLYGSRLQFTTNPTTGQLTNKTPYGNYSPAGPACGTCYNIKRGSASINVVIVDRCGGDCQTLNGACTTSGTANGHLECGNCINAKQMGNPTCSCLSPSASAQGWCDAQQTVFCDWCSGNDHPHFDLDRTSFATICGDPEAGFCQLDSFQLIDCGDYQNVPWPNGKPTPVAPLNAGTTQTTAAPSNPTTQSPSTTTPTTTTTTTASPGTTTTTTASPSSGSNGVSPRGRCSASFTCTSLGWPGQCCSQYGYCGTDSSFCGANCAAECSPSKRSVIPSSDDFHAMEMIATTDSDTERSGACMSLTFTQSMLHVWTNEKGEVASEWLVMASQSASNVVVGLHPKPKSISNASLLRNTENEVSPVAERWTYTVAGRNPAAIKTIYASC